jgi:hypothetical protein
MTGPRRVLAREDGEVVLPYTLCIAMTLVFFVLLANVIVALYGRGVVRAALDEGVRAGSRAPNGSAECQQQAEQALDQLLGGPMGQGVAVRCGVVAGRMVADATVSFSGWLPFSPDFNFDVGASATKEELP